MGEKKKYYIVDKNVLPEVFLKVVEAKKLLEMGQILTVQEAAEKVGISRSSFYKYKDAVFPFYENTRGKTITLALQLEDEPGLLSYVLNVIAQTGANILTINQNIPINGIANVTISIETFPMSEDIEDLIEKVEASQGVRHIKIIARE
ncbi:MAG: ACT domain-containing protein [Epulopiscium sp.]|nr:ACT domain-containing protein [Candidatus Epulonipiscium sp.]